MLSGVSETSIKAMVRDALTSLQPCWFTCDPNFARNIFVNDVMFNSVGVEILPGLNVDPTTTPPPNAKVGDGCYPTDSVELSLFKLKDPFFPGQKGLYSIFEPRYRSMIHDSFNGEAYFGICLPPLISSPLDANHQDEQDMVDPTHQLGTLCKIVQINEVHPDGSSVVILEGMKRFRVRRERVGPFGLSKADVEFVEDTVEEDASHLDDIKVLVRDIHLMLLKRVHPSAIKHLMDEPGESAGIEGYIQYSFWLSAILQAPRSSKNIWYRTKSTLARLQKIQKHLNGEDGGDTEESEWQWLK